jgi:hypothetical protein
MSSESSTVKNDVPLLVFPDPMVSLGMLSGATFLYFRRRLLVSLPPLSFVCDPNAIMRLIEVRRPNWGPLYGQVFAWWKSQIDDWVEIDKVLKPLGHDVIQGVYTVYPADDSALDRITVMLASVGVTEEELFPVVDFRNACGECMRHILLEK